MKKITSLFLTLVLMVGICSYGAYADNSGVKISLNGEMKSLVAYNIKDNNYFKLRDIANLLKGTDSEFDVIWNESKGAIELLTKTPYSTSEALTSEPLKNPIATSSYVSIYKDGAVVFLGAYNIADNNYFKLRDVAAVIDFGVDWDEANQTIKIDTSKSYEYPTSLMPEIDFVGRYESPNVVDGSYIEVRKNGSEYEASYLLVRMAGSYRFVPANLISDNKMLILDDEEPFENLALEWSDSNTLTIFSTDSKWHYMASSSPIPFYKK